jgi:dTDP-4-amino-4,6-dideoxygalactose transaminase
MDSIKMVDLHTQYLRMKSDIDKAIQDVLTSTAFIQGPQVKKFADELKDYTGALHVIPCANGTDALQIAMMALGFKPGDEVILPVHTYVATAEVIALLGLTPVFIDVDDTYYNIDPQQLEKKITSRTVAIVPVHLYGQCSPMEEILSIAAAHNLHVIEDAAQALGAQYTFASGTRKMAGTMGTIGTTSFFPSKNLGCFGDGGAMFTNDDTLAEQLTMIAQHGQKIKYHHDVVGVNSRLDTLQAAILSVKLTHLNAFTEKRNAVAAYYDAHLSDLPEVQLPARHPSSTHVFHQYTVQVPQVKRDELKKFLETHGIPTMIYYPVPLHFQKAYQRPGFGLGSFPVTERLSSRVLSLPIHTEMDEEQLQYICSILHRFFNG